MTKRIKPSKCDQSIKGIASSDADLISAENISPMAVAISLARDNALPTCEICSKKTEGEEAKE